MSNHDLFKFKKAKTIVKELTNLLKIIELSIAGLTPFRKYTSISETLSCLEDNKTILTVHLQHHSAILKNKGEDIEA
jgi:hypothetical protein